MKPLLALITVSEATIGVFVKLTDDRIPVQTLTFYAMAFAAAFLFIARGLVNRQWPRFPRGNVKDTAKRGRTPLPMCMEHMCARPGAPKSTPPGTGTYVPRLAAPQLKSRRC